MPQTSGGCSVVKRWRGTPIKPGGIAARWRMAALQLICIGLLWLQALPMARAEAYALLVGVNEVVALPPRLRLRGPANDVSLMRQALIARGLAPSNITLLGQRLPEAQGAPTYAQVTQAMGRIVATVGPGDVVVLHLAGHGVQVPQPAQRAGDTSLEPDGLDEVFLLQDTGAWDAAQGQLPRALRDDDIGAWIDKLVDRGARVLALFDSCHAAGMAREASTYARWRSVAGAELGVPRQTALAEVSRRPPTHRQPARTDGRILAYAARGHELAGEEWLPKADEGGSLARSRVQGVFSFELAAALMAGVRTVDDLSAALRQRYAAARRLSPSPLVQGDGPLLKP